MILFKHSTAMNKPIYHYPAHLLIFFIVIALEAGCKNASSDDVWIETKDVAFIADKGTPENGKQYLEIIYENIGTDALRKIKYQLITRTGSKIDTIEKIIIPETVFKPKDKHLVQRSIGEQPATFDEVHIGKIWVVKDTK